MNSTYVEFLAHFKFLGIYTTCIAVVVLLMHLARGKRIGATKYAIVLMLPLIVAFVSSPIDLGWWWCDHIVYAMGFLQATTLQFEGSEVVFTLFNYIVRSFTDNTVIFFVLTSSIYTLTYILDCKRITNSKATLSLLTLCFGGPFFISYLDNTLRAGMAIALVMLAFSYLRESRMKAGFIAVLAAGIHTSVAYYYPKPKVYFAFWFLSIAASLAGGHFFAELFSGLVDDKRMEDYLMQDEAVAALRYNVGFRWDFILYSLLPLVVGWYFIVKKHFRDKMYVTLYSAYIIANIFWILVIRAPFSDRFAYLSWFMIPFLYGIPLLQDHKIVKKPILWYCGFLAISIGVKIMI
jgi:hypothetical protein